MKKKYNTIVDSIDTVSISGEASLARQVEYYRWLAEQGGKKRVREIDLLTRLNAEQKATKEKLKYRIELDNLLNDISRLFLGMSEVDSDKIIQSVLKTIAEFYSAKHCFVFERDAKSRESTLMHSWTAEGFETSFHPTGTLSKECRAMISNGFGFHNTPQTDELQRISGRMFACLDPDFDSQAALAVPLYSEGDVYGILGFEGYKILHWNEEDIGFIRTLSDILTNSLERDRIAKEREKLEEQLQIRQRIDSLGSLTGGIAHDLNNLLVSIIGNIDIVLQDENGIEDKLRGNLEKSLQSSQRAANLIKELQAFSKGTVSKKTTIDLYDIAKNVFDFLNRTTHVFIEKKLCLEPDTFFVYGSEDMLHQALFNLGTNAVHAIEEKGPRPDDYIRLDARKYSSVRFDQTGLPEGKYIHIVFEDNGIGMSEKVKARAFDPMFTTRRSSYKGQGLGLAMVYKTITQDHNGAITIESEEGRGSVFHIYLPESREKCDRKEHTTTDEPRGSETVLVVDDDHSVTDLIDEVLKMYGYSVITAGDGEEGLRKFIEYGDKIDLVLLDLIMPKMTGAELFEKIREINPEMKVILSSGHSENDMHEVLNVNSYLVKPYDLSKLATTIRGTLDNP